MIWRRRRSGRVKTPIGAEGHALGGRRPGMARGVWVGFVDAEEGHPGAAQSERSRADDSVTAQDAFELPADAAKVYHARSPWKEDAGQPGDYCFLRRRRMSFTSLPSRYSRSTSCLLRVRSAEGRMDAMITPTLLVLAAGMGSRYGGLKQLDPVGPGRRNHHGLLDLRRPARGIRQSRVRDPQGDRGDIQRKDRVSL